MARAQKPFCFTSISIVARILKELNTSFKSCLSRSKSGIKASSIVNYREKSARFHDGSIFLFSRISPEFRQPENRSAHFIPADAYQVFI